MFWSVKIFFFKEMKEEKNSVTTKNRCKGGGGKNFAEMSAK